MHSSHLKERPQDITSTETLIFQFLLHTDINSFRKENLFDISEELRMKYSAIPLKNFEKKYLNKKKGFLQTLPDDSNIFASLPLGALNSSVIRASTILEKNDLRKISFLEYYLEFFHFFH